MNKSLRYITKTGSLALAMLLMAACSSGGSSSTSTGTGDDTGSTTATPAGGITDSSGLALTNVDTSDPVYLSLTGLTANSQYTVTVTAPDGSVLSPDGGFIATADEDGAIPNSTLLQDLSTTSATSLHAKTRGRKPSPRVAAQEGEYTVAVTDADGTAIMTDTFTAVDDDKVYCADSDGVARASFTPSEDVNIKIEKGSAGSLADGSYACYILSDLSTALEEGETLAGNSGSVTVASGVGTVSIGTFASGQYDIVCDINANGTFEKATDLLARPGRFRPCFTIQNANDGSDIYGQVCSDRNGNYRDVFDPNATNSDIRDVFAWISPAQQSLVEHTIGVRKYVVTHKDSWTDGDTFTDVTGDSATSAYDVDSVQGFCTNESPWLVWPRERMRQGCFDCIIDVNANGTYDKGTDFIDNMDNAGDNSTCGMRVTDTACAANDIVITSHTDGQSVDATAITLEGTFGVAPTSAFVTIAAGSQTTTVNINVDAAGVDGVVAFSAAIPLFSGENILTVTTITGAETGCSETIAVTSTSTSTSSELFRAQMTWDGDTDMDLHLVRPTGTYSNGGGGADDCNYGNCKVGLDAATENSIDWGATGEDDDPKLDVDCIACGNGIENIWMNGITDDDGDYKVYVDAYSGTETAVSVSISIRGASVGTVSCGDMSSGSATDSCFVGTISWTGGSTGTGTFTPSGTKAASF